MDILDGYVTNGWLAEFSTLEELTEYVEGPPVLNKFACIVKQKPDGSTKRRIIMDSKRSSVTAASRKMYKATFPRATDLVADILSLQANAPQNESVEAFVLDAEDCFVFDNDGSYVCALAKVYLVLDLLSVTDD